MFLNDQKYSARGIYYVNSLTQGTNVIARSASSNEATHTPLPSFRAKRSNPFDTLVGLLRFARNDGWSEPGLSHSRLKPLLLYLDHLEVLLARAAVGAAPGKGHIAPSCAGRDTGFGLALFLVVHETANQTHVGLHT